MEFDWKAVGNVLTFWFALGNILAFGFIAAMVAYWWRHKGENDGQKA